MLQPEEPPAPDAAAPPATAPLQPTVALQPTRKEQEPEVHYDANWAGLLDETPPPTAVRLLEGDAVCTTLGRGCYR